MRVIAAFCLSLLWAAAADANALLVGLEEDLARVSPFFPVPSARFGEDFAVAVSKDGNLFFRVSKVRDGGRASTNGVPVQRSSVSRTDAFSSAHQQKSFQSRGAFIRLGIYLMHTESPLPPVYAGYGGASRDGYRRGFDRKPFFSFSRASGARFPLLWPDVDTYGWPESWIAPHSVVQEILRAESLPWEQRQSKLFWPGVAMTPVRRAVEDCAVRRPFAVVHQKPDWIAWQGGSGNATKPPAGDLRALLSHRFLISLPGREGSSSSLKRAACSGGVLIMPRSPPFVDPAARALQTCPDCWAPLDANNVTGICDSLLETRRSLSGAAGEQMAARLAAFAETHLSTAAYEAYGRAALSGLSRIQRHVSDKLLLAAGFKRVTCELVVADLRREVAPQFWWQVPLWYNLTTCQPLPNASAYLASAPL